MRRRRVHALRVRENAVATYTSWLFAIVAFLMKSITLLMPSHTYSARISCASHACPHAFEESIIT